MALIFTRFVMVADVRDKPTLKTIGMCAMCIFCISICHVIR